MKNTKKIFAVLIAFVLTLSMAIPAFAAGTNQITVTGTVKDETYNLYKMADLTTDGEAYSYTVTPAWLNFFKQDNIQAYFKVNANGILTAVEGLTSNSDAMRTFSKLASAYAEANNISADATQTSTDDGSSIVFGNLDNGYYMISSTLGTLAIIESTPKNTTQEIKEKNEGPTLDKSVEEDSTNTFGSANDAEVGQTVNFKVVIAGKSGAKNYVMHDKMESGLKFDSDSVVIKAGGNALVAGRDYNVITNPEDDCTFEIEFTQTYLNTITKAMTSTAKQITITYSATLTADALEYVDGVKNEAKLTYGDKQSTEWDPTTTTTHAIELLKYKGDDTAKNPLAGATFELKNEDMETLALVKIDDNHYRLATDEDTNTVTSFVTNDLGKIKISGLDSDTYYLTETEAPVGYNILVKDTEVLVSHDEVLTFEIANNTGKELPSTGGIGTTIFYIAGGALVVAAVAVLITKRRMGAEEA